MDKNTITITTMQSEDIDLVYAIEREANKNPWTKENFISSLRYQNIHSLVLRSHNEIRGFIIFSIISDELTILNIAIAYNSQGMGLGQILFSYAHTYAIDHGVRTAYLEVSNRNKRAIHFYTKEGYSICGQRPKYYANGDDALLMRRIL